MQRPVDLRSPRSRARVALASTLIALGSSAACSDDPLTRLEAHVAVEPRAIDFGRVDEGTRARREITVENIGAGAVELASVTLTSTSVELGLNRGLVAPLVLAAGTSTVVTVVYAPRDLGGDVGVVTIAPNDREASAVEVSLRGRANLAPRAVAWACRAGAEAGCGSGQRSRSLPARLFARFALEGRESFDLDGAITAYRWALVSRPAGSNAVVFHSSEDLSMRHRGTGEVEVDRAGLYELRLVARDELGLESFDTPESHVVLRPRDLDVSLEWDVATDIDLHVVRPGGMLGDYGSGRAGLSMGSDCSAFNRAPSWGDPSTDEDDPSLDKDDVTGVGPEQVSLDRPDPSGPYRVFVHACDSHGTGVPVEVHLEVRVRGERVRRVPREGAYPLLPGEVWEAAQIVWHAARETAEVTEPESAVPRPAPELCRLGPP